MVVTILRILLILCISSRKRLIRKLYFLITLGFIDTHIEHNFINYTILPSECDGKQQLQLFWNLGYYFIYGIQSRKCITMTYL